MAFEVEAWWSLHYPKYSLRDLNRLPVYHRFLQIRYPFEHEDDRAKEKFETSDEVDRYEWRDLRAGKQESFSHNRKLNRFEYSLSYRDLESPISLTSYIVNNLEGGTISRDYGAFQVHEAWEITPSGKTFERYTTEKGVKKGFRCGLVPNGDDCERWTEEIWETEGQSLFSKQWHKEGESGGVTTNKKGDYTWGESWNSSWKGEEKKTWHKDGTKEWGHASGKDDRARWDHTWNLSESSKFEEKVTAIGKTDTGYRYVSNGADWYKQEWSGPRVIGADEGKDSARLANVRERLNYLYASELAATLRQEQTLTSLLSYAPEFKSKVDSLVQKREAVTVNEQCVDSLFAGIFTLRDLQNEQEKLTQESFFALRDYLGQISHTVQTFTSTLETALASLGRLGQALKDEGEYHRHHSQVEAWKEDTGKPVFERIQAAFQLIDSLEVAKREEISKWQGSLLPADVSKAVSKAYELISRFDSLSTSYSEDDHCKPILDSLPSAFDSAYKPYHDRKDPTAVVTLLSLAQEYVAVYAHAVGSAKGWDAKTAESEWTKAAECYSATRDRPDLTAVREKAKQT